MCLALEMCLAPSWAPSWALTSVGEFLEISWNHSLPDCEACDLLGQLTTGPTAIDVSDNLDDTCTPVPASCP